MDACRLDLEIEITVRYFHMGKVQERKNEGLFLEFGVEQLNKWC